MAEEKLIYTLETYLKRNSVTSEVRIDVLKSKRLHADQAAKVGC